MGANNLMVGPCIASVNFVKVMGCTGTGTEGARDIGAGAQVHCWLRA
jgi:hypothetical protein